MKTLAAWAQGLLIGITVAVLMLAGVTPALAADKVTILHVFVAAGQSNMSGRGLPMGTTNDPGDPRIFQYGGKSHTLRQATIPLDMLDTARGISPATTFAREYLKYQPSNVGVLIIPAGYGATSFTNSPGTRTWNVGAATAPQYDLPAQVVTLARQGIAAAVAARYTVSLKGVLWHQGEGNWWMSTAAYSEKLDQLIAYFRSRFTAPKLPFVVGGLAPEGIAAQPRSANIDKSHKGTPARVPYTGFAPSMAGGVNAGDPFHFSRAGVEFLGKSYLTGYARAAKVTYGPVPRSPAPGAAFSTFGAIRDYWQQQKSENGPLGYPTSNAFCGLKNGGCFQNYQGGTVMWSAATGAQTVRPGPVQRVWQRSGFENGSLGYPGSGLICGLKNSGCFQNFQQGSVLYSPATGAHPVYAGPFQSVWAPSGFENGSLGYPTSDQVCGLRNRGCFQNFVGGTIMYSPATRAQPITFQPVLAAWGRSGYENGSLGYPTSWIVCGLKKGGCFQNFEKGSIMWSQATGARPVTVGPLQSAWGSQGFENGALGYPTGTQSCNADRSSCTQTFQGGRLTWTAAAGVRRDTA